MMKRLLGFVMMVMGLVCIGSIIRAEEIKIEGMEEAMGDISASTHQRKDLNGNVCALVKVELPLRGALFEGNVVGDTEFRGGEYWVYMTPGSKMLKVKHDDVKPVMVNFTDYGIPALESKTTYTLVLTPPSMGYNKGDGANGSYLVLDITPKTGVFVEVDGKPLVIEDGQASTFLEYGTHEFTVRANGYDTYTGTAKIEKGINTTIPVNLESVMGELTFEITPKVDGVLEIAGKYIPVTNGKASLNLENGEYSYSVKASGYDTYSGTVQLIRGQNSVISVNIVPMIGELVFEVTPETDAMVEIAGQYIPLSNGKASISLEFGEHPYSIKASGYDTYSGIAQVARGKTTVIPVNLLSNMADLTVKTKTVGATIKINGKEKGADFFTERIAPGTYLIEVEKPSHIPWSETIILAERDNKTLTVPELQPIYGSLNIDYKPIGSIVSIDGKEIGTTPAMIGDLLIGKHTVTISKEGYETQTASLTILESETASLKGNLPEKPMISVDELKKKYDHIFDFSEGMAIVVVNGKYGYIDKYGAEIVPLKFEAAGDFHDGLARVKKEGNHGYIDKTGKEVIPLKYDWAWDFSEGMASVQLNGKYGYIDNTGKEVIPFKFDEAYNFSKGLARIFVNGKYAFIDKTGNVVISLKYDIVKDLKNGLAAVVKKGKWGYIDNTGKEVIPLQYDGTFWDFSHGIAAVKLYTSKRKDWAIIDLNGKEISPHGYDEVKPYKEGAARVQYKGQWGFLDINGNELAPCQYDYVENFSEGMALVKLKWKRGFIDKTGKEVIPIKYDWAWNFSEGMARVQLNGKYGFIDKTGNEVIPIKYQEVDEFLEGLTAVKLNDKWGIIDKTGKEEIPLKYDYIKRLDKSTYKVKLNNKWGIFMPERQEVSPLKYDSMDDIEYGKIIKVKLNGKYGFIDKTGKEVITPIYDEVKYIRHWGARVMLNGREFSIDWKGKEVLDL